MSIIMGGRGPGMHNFKWYKIAELSEISRKNTIFALRGGDHTFEPCAQFSSNFFRPILLG